MNDRMTSPDNTSNLEQIREARKELRRLRGQP